MYGEFQFFSYNKRTDWQKGEAYNLTISDQGIRLKQTLKYGVERVLQLDQIEGPAPIQDVSLSRTGKLFMVDEEANLWSYDYKNNYHELHFPVKHQLFTKEARITSIQDQIIVIDKSMEQTITAYAESNGQILWTRREWNSLPLYPLAITESELAYFYILIPLQLETSSSGEPIIPKDTKLALVKMNLSGEIISFIEHEELRLGQKTKATHLSQRFYIQLAKDGQVHLLDTERSKLLIFQQDGRLTTSIALPQRSYAGLCLDSTQQIYVGDSRERSEEGEDERFILSLHPDQDQPERVAGFRGKVTKLMIDQQDKLYIWNEWEQLFTILTLQPRTMELEELRILEGIYFFTALDSTVEETVWHKLLMEAEIPEETQVRIAYFASDSQEFIRNGSLHKIDNFLKDKNIPLTEKLDAFASKWSKPIINPKDALLINAKGRYLWIKLELVGSEQQSPLIRKMRFYYPRMSLLSFLPAIYQEDEKSRDFLERFLSLYGSFFLHLEEQIANMSQYIDVDAAPPEFVTWLSNWLALAVDDSWEEEQIRKLVKHAPELYKRRGTRYGIEQMIEIYTGEKPFIIEYFQYRRLQEQSELRKIFSDLYGDNPYSFCVLVKPESVPTKKKRLMVEKILNDEKPAYTEAKLVVLEPWIYMDKHSYLGINTVLSELSLLRLDHKSAMPYDTVIIDVDLDNRLDINTRLELDSELE